METLPVQISRRLARIPDLRWNIAVLGSDIALFGLGMNISSSITIMPLFAYHLTNENWVVSLIPALRALGVYVPPIFVAGLVEQRHRSLPIVRDFTLYERIPFLLMAALAVLLPHGHDTLVLIGFLALVTVQALGSGLSFAPWLDFIARSIPESVRGRFLGGSVGIGNGTGALGTVLAAALIANLPWPWSFAACYTITFVILMLSFIMLITGRETPRASEHVQQRPTGGWYRRAAIRARVMGQVLRSDGAFRRLLFANALIGLSSLSMGLLAVAALRQAHMTDVAVGLEGTVLVVATIVGSFFWGWLGDRAGHRMVLAWGSLCGVISMVFAVLAHSALLMTPAFFFFGISFAAIGLAQLTYVVEFGTPERRPTYISLSLAFFAPFAGLAPVLGGIIADRFGYPPAFLLALALSVAATAAYFWWVRDPETAMQPETIVASAME
jgi:MFS family permease